AKPTEAPLGARRLANHLLAVAAGAGFLWQDVAQSSVDYFAMENRRQLAQKLNGSSHLRYATERLVFLSHKSAVLDAGGAGCNGVADLLSVCDFCFACRCSHIPEHLLEKSSGGLRYRTGKSVHAHRVPSPSEPCHARRSGSFGSADDGDPRE